MQCGKLAIWLDERTDVFNMSQLMVFPRFCFNNEICEHVVFCESLKERKMYWKRYNLNSKLL